MIDKNILYILDDSSDLSIKKDSFVVFLSEDDDSYPNRINILEFFKNNSEYLKKELLDLNNVTFDKIKDYMENDDDYKYLLSSLIFEKSPYKTDSIYTFFKVRIILKFIEENKIEEIIIFSKNISIVNFFIQYAKNNNIKVVNKNNIKQKFSLKEFVQKNLFFSFIYVFLRETRKIFKNIKKNNQINKKLVVSYYPNYYFDNNKNFISKYFSKVSYELNKNYDWLFIYADNIKKIKTEEKILLENKFHNYNFLDAYISFKNLFSIFLKLLFLSNKFKQINVYKLFEYKGINYYDIFKDDWKKSLSYVLIDTIIFEKKFYNFFKNNNYEEVLYLLEYQPWEQMLNKVIKNRNSNIKSKGVTHSVIRPNLMNYFHSQKVHKFMYNPDYVGANAELAKEIFINNGFLSEQVKEIEAQRFLYLSKIKVDNKEKNNNLLITTSISFLETKELLETFVKAYENGVFNKIYIKSHPDLPVNSIIKDIPNFPKFIKLNNSMEEAFKLANYIYTANSSSVLLESILNKKATITLFSLQTLPMPVFNKHPFLFIATTSQELKNIFMNLKNCNNLNLNSEDENILYLANNLEKWKEFINV